VASFLVMGIRGARAGIWRWASAAWVVIACLIVAFGSAMMGCSIGASNELPPSPENVYGVNVFLEREVESWKREKTLAMVEAAGIGWIKQHFPWEDIEQRGKGDFHWQKYDEIVALAEKHGLRVIARLDRPPSWTRRDNSYAQRPPDDFDDYGDFVYAFVERYKGRIQYVQIWNEPNIWPEWGNQAVDPAGYVKLLSVAYQRAKEADPACQVLSAPLAVNTEDSAIRRNLSDLVYLEEMYQAGAGNHFDILSVNAFGMNRPPDDPPDPATLNFRRVELQRAIMESHGDSHKPIWFNEYGWNAAPAELRPEMLVWSRVTEEEQARYTVGGIDWAREHWPWAGVFCIWYFRQVGDVPETRADYYFRMVDTDFTPRLLYEAVRSAASP